METSIRFLRIEGYPMKPALCFRARNQAHAVINDQTTIRAISHISLKDHDLAAPVLYPADPNKVYPIKRFVDHFNRIGERKGITQRAKFFLLRAINGGVEDDADLPPDTTDPLDGIPNDPLGIAGGLKEIERSGRRSPDAPKPGKPASEALRKPPARSGAPLGGTLIARLAVEFKVEPAKLRKLLRSKGLSAPYDNEALIRKAAGK